MIRRLLSSRKFVGGLVTVIVGVSFAAFGDKMTDKGMTPASMETTLMGIFGIGLAFVGGTAWEDAAAKRNVIPMIEVGNSPKRKK